MRNTTKLTALLSAALILTGIGTAQTKTPTTGTGANAPAQETASAPQSSSGEPQDDVPHTAPVFWIQSIEILRSTHAPQLDVIRVRGLATTEGWESAELIPLTKGIPADGILDLILVGEAPADSTKPTSYPGVEAVFTLEPGHPFKGVRVHGAANRLSLKTLPGYIESVAPPKDCTTCTGKLFVPKGQTAPAGRASETIVREEDLPHNLRVIRETDGIESIDSNPNRMTMLLNEKSEIVVVMWD